MSELVAGLLTHRGGNHEQTWKKEKKKVFLKEGKLVEIYVTESEKYMGGLSKVGIGFG